MHLVPPTLPIKDRESGATPALDRGAIFTTLLNRQALRRESKVPPLDVRAEFERAVDYALWTAHVAEHGKKVRAEVLAQQRAKHGRGWGYSAGGRWVVQFLAAKRLTEMYKNSR